MAGRPRLAGGLPARLGARRAATVAGRRAERSGAARPGRLAGGRADRHRPPAHARPGPSTAAELRAAEPAYAAAMARIVPALATALGTDLPGVVERSGVVDRAGWVRANIGAFASLIGKLEADLLDQVMPPGGGLAKASMALANRWVTTRQLGFLLGFMGQRVLGQYDLALLSAEAAPGPAPVRRGEHPRDGDERWACRSSRSGPGSPSTRRPTPSSSRRTPGCARTSPSRLERQLTPVRQGRRASAARPCAGVRPDAPRRGATASTGWSG